MPAEGLYPMLIQQASNAVLSILVSHTELGQIQLNIFLKVICIAPKFKVL